MGATKNDVLKSLKYDFQNLIFKNINLLSARSSSHFDYVDTSQSGRTFAFEFSLGIFTYSFLEAMNRTHWTLTINILMIFLFSSFCLFILVYIFQLTQASRQAGQLRVSIKHARKVKNRFCDASMKCTVYVNKAQIKRHLTVWETWQARETELSGRSVNKKIGNFWNFSSVLSRIQLILINSVQNMENNSSNRYTEKCVSCIFVLISSSNQIVKVDISRDFESGKKTNIS